MRLKILFITLVALSSCASIKPPPNFHLGTAVWNEDLEHSYGSFSLYQDPRNPKHKYRKSAEEIFKEKTVLLPYTDYFKLLKYKQYLEVELKALEEKLKRCKN